jgi:sialidase-1
LVPSLGRWVVPADHIDPANGTASHAFLSDDGGSTWALSTYLPGGNECQAAAMPWVGPAALALTMRNTRPLRTLATSHDGGATWSPATALWNETECEGSLAALPHHPAGPCLVISSAFAAASRANMTLHTSWDDGVTWRAVVTVYAGAAAYSTLVPLAAGGSVGGSVGVAWERDGYAAIAWQGVAVPGPT